MKNRGILPSGSKTENVSKSKSILLKKGGEVIDIIEKTEQNILSTKIAGKLTEEDYKQMYPLFEETVDKFGKIKLYVELENFEGWSSFQAFSDEVKMDTKHYNDFEKVAIVGEKQWENMLTGIADFINPAQIEFFTPDKKEEAKSWLYKN